MITASHIDPKTVARELLDDVEVDYPIYGPSPVSRVKLPDGRAATLQVTFDDSAGIGRWIDSGGKTVEHHDDLFGTFTFRGTDRLYGYPAERPRTFDGRARVLRPRDNGARIGDPVWWQPPEDVPDADLPDLEREVRAYLETGDWFHVGLRVRVVDPGGDAGGDASLWGVEWEFPADDPEAYADHLRDTVAELLEEAGIGQASTANVARWARDPLEAVARRIADEDSPEYADALRDVLAWWESHVEPVGDWDQYGGPLADAIERDYQRARNLERSNANRKDRS